MDFVRPDDAADGSRRRFLIAAIGEDGAEPPVLYRAVGCESCNHTGYRGRSAIVEVLQMSDAIRQAILRGTDVGEINRLAREAGMQTMQRHGLKKAISGTTSIEEVMRVTRAG